MAGDRLHGYQGLSEDAWLVINPAGGAGWIEKASRELLNRGKLERSKLTDTKSILDFYTLHFRYLLYFKAAQNRI